MTVFAAERSAGARSAQCGALPQTCLLNGDLLDGGKAYRLHVDPDPPAENFWAVDVYDIQTRSLIQVPSTIWPAVASNSGTLKANPDGSYDLYFGSTAPAGKESNWVQTIPRKSWFQLFRLYGPPTVV